LITIKSNGNEVKAGNETVLFRHEKTFYNRPGLFVRIRDDWELEKIREVVTSIDRYSVNYVGIELKVDGFAVESVSGNRENFQNTIKVMRECSKMPAIIISEIPEIVEAGLDLLKDEHPLIFGATSDNWDEMAKLAKRCSAPLVVKAPTLDELAELTEKIKEKGVEDLVIDPMGYEMGKMLAFFTQTRRLCLKKNFRPLGYPVLAVCQTPEMVAQAITKYAGFIIQDSIKPATLYPLLVLRQNIYTDPQKPIQVQPGLYEINAPQPESPLLVTTNFSITYFSVANEVEGSGLPAWLLVTDAEGMSVLTAWAAGKFDAERIAKSVKGLNIADKVSRKLIVLPGHVAVLSGELEAELPDWEIRVGPREAVDIPKFMKQSL
jgi:acetyl-CoA decarbonylase/synthase, CODH/ACS complex subunit gamma